MTTIAPTPRVIGTRTPKVDGVEKVTGRAQYGADVQLPGLLVGRILHSPHAHARIVRIDTSAAEDLPGVMAVVTGADFPLPPPGTETPFGTVTERSYFIAQEVIARDKALYHGHTVAAVAARTAEAAERALELIDVEYEPLPPVLDAVEAMLPGALVLHDDLFTKSPEGVASEPSNVAEQVVFERGNVGAGFAEAVVVVEREYKTQVVHQGYIEPNVDSAYVDPQGNVTVWANTQGIFGQRRDIAMIAGVLPSRIKVIPTEVGGGFGGKTTVRCSALAVALSRKAGMPVRVALSREEVLRTAGPGNAITCRVKLGAKSDGTLTAVEGSFVYDAGAFPGAPVRLAIRRVFSHYRSANFCVEGFDVVTNHAHVHAYRAPGGTPTAFALESTMDELAEALGMDPLELRRINVSHAGDPMPDNVPLTSVSFDRVLDAIEAHPCWTTPIEGANRGRGLALGMWTVPGGTASSHITLSGDGSVALVLGTVDLSSTRTSLAMVAAELLGIDMRDVRVIVGDTDIVGYSDSSSGDMVTYVASRAVREASIDLLGKMKATAAAHFSVDVADIEYAGKRFYVRGASEMAIGWADVAQKAPGSGGALVGYGSVNTPSMNLGVLAPNAAAHVVDVEVDPDTGKVELLRYTAFQDVGLSVNPDQVEGQVQGGVAQGIGWALHEEYDFDESGVLRNATLLDYRLPTSLDVPPIETVVLEEAAPEHPLGIRAAGQVPIVPPVAAIANAIRNATGARIRRLPMKPETVFWALQENSK